MIDAPDNSEELDDGNVDSKGKGKSGKSGSGSGGGIRLPPSMLKDVTSNWEYLDVTKVAARMAEFFSELPARASAHIQVKWANLHNKGFTIVTDLLKRGQEMARLLSNPTRENIEILRQQFGISGPSG